ncbi:MAG: GTP-binding protein [Oceanobacter sp.]
MADSRPSARKLVRTHVITGFLGTGKTTLIMHLLKHKPEHEKWAVLVNEFGEIGVDGAILQAQAGEASGIAIREVPGGCLCCAAGLPFQIGINWLIAREKPDVLLIEPTGLGHPAELLDSLRSDSYCSVLEVGATLTLVDARHLSNPKYRQHQIYNDQLNVADVLIANKADLATDADWTALEQLIHTLQQDKPELVSDRVQNGEVDPALLATPVPVAPDTHSQTANTSTANAPAAMPMVLDLSTPVQRANDEDFHRIENQGDGMVSVGWLIRPEWVFDLTQIRDWFGGLEVERAKAVLNTSAGRRIFNLREGMLTELDCSDSATEDSRLELILMAGTHTDTDTDTGTDTTERLEQGWHASLQ